MRRTWHVQWGAFCCVLFVLGGCMVVPKPRPAEEMRAAVASYQLPRLPEDGKAMVYVVFRESWYGKIRFDVFLNNQDPQSAIGYNMGGQYICFEITPGEHMILSKAGNWAELRVSAKAGDIIFIRQEPYPGFIDARNRLAILPEYEGKYYVQTLAPGTIVNANVKSMPTAPVQAQQAPRGGADTVTGTVTGGNLAKGVGFSNLNVKLTVKLDSGVEEIFFVRSDSIIIDAAGKQVDYLYASRSKDKKVEITQFIITDATGGAPGRTDFAYEIGKKGVRVMRFLD